MPISNSELQANAGKVIKINLSGTDIEFVSPGGTAKWGGITGTLSSQTDLQGVLDSKSNTHSHPYASDTHSHNGIYEPANTNIQTHVVSSHAPSNAQKNSDITKAEIETKLTGAISTHTHAGGAGGNGYCIQGSAANQATTTDSQTLYWGDIQLAPTTTGGNTRIYIPKAGTIKAAYVFAHSATAGTAESWSMNIRKNNSIDTLIQALASASAQRVWSNTALNTAVALGDYVEIKEIQPLWATNPANVRRNFILYIE